jgi:putative methyltransferase, YaeB/AF_0241 family
MDIIARMHSEFPEKFGIPRQSGLVPALRATIVFEPAFRNADALRGLEEFSHLWLIWGFHRAEKKGGLWSPTVRPPRLGGNERMGVFATRSPFRPNGLGLSAVELIALEQVAEHGTVIHVAGADLMDGTPIYDVKPYLPYTDCIPQAAGGFAATAPQGRLTVVFAQGANAVLSVEQRETLVAVLAQDPRPSYQDDAQRIYGMDFGGWGVKFSVADSVLTVRSLERA